MSPSESPTKSDLSQKTMYDYMQKRGKSYKHHNEVPKSHIMSSSNSAPTIQTSKKSFKPKYVPKIIRVKKKVSQSVQKQIIVPKRISSKSPKKFQETCTNGKSTPMKGVNTVVHKKGSTIAQMAKKFERWRKSLLVNTDSKLRSSAPRTITTQEDTKQPYA